MPVLPRSFWFVVSKLCFVLAAILTMFPFATANPQEKKAGEVWHLDFQVKAMQSVSVDIPGKGKTLIWYLQYELTNKTTQAPRFIPLFHLVDPMRKVFHADQIIPLAVEAVKRGEKPGGEPVLNSLEIATSPIEPNKSVTGLALWVIDKPAAKDFRIFVRGLSNGFAVMGKDVRHKTLQLNFQRIQDPKLPGGEVLRFQPPPAWVYLPGKNNGPGNPTPTGGK